MNKKSHNSYLKKLCRDNSITCIRLSGLKGIPSWSLVYPSGKVMFLEITGGGEEPSKEQHKVMKYLLRRNQSVRWSNSKDYTKELLEQHIKETPLDTP